VEAKIAVKVVITEPEKEKVKNLPPKVTEQKAKIPAVFESKIFSGLSLPTSKQALETLIQDTCKVK